MREGAAEEALQEGALLHEQRAVGEQRVGEGGDEGEQAAGDGWGGRGDGRGEGGWGMEFEERNGVGGGAPEVEGDSFTLLLRRGGSRLASLNGA